MSIYSSTRNIDVVILCGGLGKRLRSVVSDKPKPMAQIGNRPFLDILLSYISSFGFKRFILCIGYKGKFIKDYYKNKSNSLEIFFSEEEELLGTAGAVKNAEPMIKSKTFLIMNGDSFCKVNFMDFLNFHYKKKAFCSIVLVKSEKTSEFGVIEIDDSNKIVSFKEKVKTEGKSLINAGIYLFEKDIFSMIPNGKSYSMEYDLFPSLVSKRFYGYISEADLLDIGTPEGYKRAEAMLSSLEDFLLREL